MGLRVLDAGNMISGPMAACLFADYGADVVKIEHPRLHDPLREWEPKRDGISLWWKVINRNKRLITLDISTPSGQDMFRRLAGWADVVLENFRPGTFERWNVGYSDLSAVNPGLILVRISGYGQTGPYSQRPGYGTIAEALSGVPAFTGTPEDPPILPAFPLADSVAGVFAVTSALAALRHRDTHSPPEGQEIDLSLYEPLFRLVDSQVIGFDQLGLVKQRMGNRMAEDAPRNTYKTKDHRWIAISASSERTFSRLAIAIGQPGLATDPRFDSSSRRIAHVEELDAILGLWFQAKTCAEAMEILLANDVVAGPIYDIQDIFNDPHFRFREDIVSVPDADFGSVRMQGVVPKFSRTPGSVRFTGGAPGSHNDEVFGQVLGLDSSAIEQLAKVGVI